MRMVATRPGRSASTPPSFSITTSSIVNSIQHHPSQHRKYYHTCHNVICFNIPTCLPFPYTISLSDIQSRAAEGWTRKYTQHESSRNHQLALPISATNNSVEEGHKFTHTQLVIATTLQQWLRIEVEKFRLGNYGVWAVTPRLSELRIHIT